MSQSTASARFDSAIRNLAANESAAIRKLRAALDRDFGLVELRLFGSKARGDSDPESDIDLLVVLRDDYDWRTQIAIYDLGFDISLEHDVLLSPLIFSESEYYSARHAVTPIHQMIEREGIPV